MVRLESQRHPMSLAYRVPVSHMDRHGTASSKRSTSSSNCTRDAKEKVARTPCIKSNEGHEGGCGQRADPTDGDVAPWRRSKTVYQLSYFLMKPR